MNNLTKLKKILRENEKPKETTVNLEKGAKRVGFLFATSVVKSLFDNMKDVTRRPLESKKMEKLNKALQDGLITEDFSAPENQEIVMAHAPCQIGDLIWVRESYKEEGYWEDKGSVSKKTGKPKKDWVSNHVAHYDDQGDAPEPKEGMVWRGKPSMHMPSWANRLCLHVKDVYIERIQDISEDQAQREGAYHYFSNRGWSEEIGGCDSSVKFYFGAAGSKAYDSPREAYMNLWDELYGWKEEYSWGANGWVWVIEFSLVHNNVDVLLPKE